MLIIAIHPSPYFCVSLVHSPSPPEGGRDWDSCVFTRNANKLIGSAAEYSIDHHHLHGNTIDCTLSLVMKQRINLHIERPRRRWKGTRRRRRRRQCCNTYFSIHWEHTLIIISRYLKYCSSSSSPWVPFNELCSTWFGWICTLPIVSNWRVLFHVCYMNSRMQKHKTHSRAAKHQLWQETTTVHDQFNNVSTAKQAALWTHQGN